MIATSLQEKFVEFKNLSNFRKTDKPDELWLYAHSPANTFNQEIEASYHHLNARFVIDVRVCFFYICIDVKWFVSELKETEFQIKRWPQSDFKFKKNIKDSRLNLYSLRLATSLDKTNIDEHDSKKF